MHAKNGIPLWKRNLYEALTEQAEINMYTVSDSAALYLLKAS